MSNSETKSPAGYVDGFVISVPKANIEKYKEIATLASQIWKEYGAIDYIESVGDDLDTEFGVSFPKLANAAENETVVFAFITYRDRAHRDEVNAKVMADERMKAMCPGENPDVEPPFDVQRMTYGGFSVLVRG